MTVDFPGNRGIMFQSAMKIQMNKKSCDGSSTALSPKNRILTKNESRDFSPLAGNQYKIGESGEINLVDKAQFIDSFKSISPDKIEHIFTLNNITKFDQEPDQNHDGELTLGSKVSSSHGRTRITDVDKKFSDNQIFSAQKVETDSKKQWSNEQNSVENVNQDEPKVCQQVILNMGLKQQSSIDTKEPERQISSDVITTPSQSINTPAFPQASNIKRLAKRRNQEFKKDQRVTTPKKSTLETIKQIEEDMSSNFQSKNNGFGMTERSKNSVSKLSGINTYHQNLLSGDIECTEGVSPQTNNHDHQRVRQQELAFSRQIIKIQKSATFKDKKIDLKEVSGCSSEMFKKNYQDRRLSNIKNIQNVQNEAKMPTKKHFYNSMSKIERLELININNTINTSGEKKKSPQSLDKKQSRKNNGNQKHLIKEGSTNTEFKFHIAPLNYAQDSAEEDDLNFKGKRKNDSHDGILRKQDGEQEGEDIHQRRFSTRQNNKNDTISENFELLGITYPNRNKAQTGSQQMSSSNSVKKHNKTHKTNEGINAKGFFELKTGNISHEENKILLSHESPSQSSSNSEEKNLRYQKPVSQFRDRIFSMNDSNHKLGVTDTIEECKNENTDTRPQEINLEIANEPIHQELGDRGSSISKTSTNEMISIKLLQSHQNRSNHNFYQPIFSPQNAKNQITDGELENESQLTSQIEKKIPRFTTQVFNQEIPHDFDTVSEKILLAKKNTIFKKNLLHGCNVSVLDDGSSNDNISDAHMQHSVYLDDGQHSFQDLKKKGKQKPKITLNQKDDDDDDKKSIKRFPRKTRQGTQNFVLKPQLFDGENEAGSSMKSSSVFDVSNASPDNEDTKSFAQKIQQQQQSLTICKNTTLVEKKQTLLDIGSPILTRGKFLAPKMKESLKKASLNRMIKKKRFGSNVTIKMQSPKNDLPCAKNLSIEASQISNFKIVTEDAIQMSQIPSEKVKDENTSQDYFQTQYVDSTLKSPLGSNDDAEAESEMTLLKQILDSPNNKQSPNSKKKIMQNAKNPLKLSEYRQLTKSMFEQLNWIKSQINQDFAELPQSKKIDFKFKKRGFKKLLIFDLDETLIHVKRNVSDEGVQDEINDGFEPEVEIDGIFDKNTGITTKASFSIRPLARECLSFANQFFEVAIFTAGNQWFAEPILNYLDPRDNLIQHRFYRQHTSQIGDDSDPLYVKDLTILCGENSELSLDDILIVDNMIYSFAFNLENGIPILNYVGDKNDSEMLHVMDYLRRFKNCNNLRKENEQNYKLNYIYQNIDNFIEYYFSSDSEDEEDDFDCDGITAHDYKTECGPEGSAMKLHEINENFSQVSSSSKITSELKIDLSNCATILQNQKTYFEKKKDEDALTLGNNFSQRSENDRITTKPLGKKSQFLNVQPSGANSVTSSNISESEKNHKPMPQNMSKFKPLKTDSVSNSHSISSKSDDNQMLVQPVVQQQQNGSFNLPSDGNPISGHEQVEDEEEEGKFIEEEVETGSRGGTSSMKIKKQSDQNQPQTFTPTIPARHVEASVPQIQEEEQQVFDKQEFNVHAEAQELEHSFNNSDGSESERDSLLQNSTEQINLFTQKKSPNRRNVHESNDHVFFPQSSHKMAKPKLKRMQTAKDKPKENKIHSASPFFEVMRMQSAQKQKDSSMNLSTNSKPIGSQVGTIRAPNWGNRKIVKMQRKMQRPPSIRRNSIMHQAQLQSANLQNANPLDTSSLARARSVSRDVAASKKIDIHLDNFATEIEKYSKSGALKLILMKSNPDLDQKLIIDSKKPSKIKSPKDSSQKAQILHQSPPSLKESLKNIETVNIPIKDPTKNDHEETESRESERLRHLEEFYSNVYSKCDDYFDFEKPQKSDFKCLSTNKRTPKSALQQNFNRVGAGSFIEQSNNQLNTQKKPSLTPGLNQNYRLIPGRSQSHMNYDYVTPKKFNKMNSDQSGKFTQKREWPVFPSSMKK